MVLQIKFWLELQVQVEIEKLGLLVLGKLNDIVGYQYFFSAGGTDVSSLTGSNFLLFQQDNGASTFYIQDYSGSTNWAINPDDVFK